MSRPATNYKGTTWGNWVVLSRAAENDSRRNAMWLCRCTACGHEQAISSNRIRRREGAICAKCEQQPSPKRTLCTDEEFVRAWQGGKTVADVAATLGGTKTQITAIAARMRQHDVPLKKMPKGKDYNELIELAKSLLPAEE